MLSRFSRVRLPVTPWIGNSWDSPGKNTGVGCQHLLPMECYSVVKKNEIMPFAVTWMQLEIIILSEVSQRKTPVQYINTYIWNLAEKAMAPHSSTLAWKIPWMEEPGRL